MLLSRLNANGLMVGARLVGKRLNESPLRILRRNEGTRKLVRRPLRVYYPGEKIPSPGEKNWKTNELGEVGERSKSAIDSNAIFRTAMAEYRKPSKHGRRDRIVLEGTKLILEALESGLKPEKLFLSKNLPEIPESLAPMLGSNAEIHRVNAKEFHAWSILDTPPGLIGIFPKPSLTLKERECREAAGAQNCLSLIPLTVILDNVREPGNLGSILRSAAAASCKQVLCSKGCVDAWDTKVLRGGSGAHFHIPLTQDVDMHQIGSHLALEEISTKPGETIAIFLADGKKGIPYTDVNFQEFENIALVLGSEAEGISENVVQTVENLKKVYPKAVKQVERLRIPLGNGIESLNVANAFGIFAFEILRQFRQKKPVR